MDTAGKVSGMPLVGALADRDVVAEVCEWVSAVVLTCYKEESYWPAYYGRWAFKLVSQETFNKRTREIGAVRYKGWNTPNGRSFSDKLNLIGDIQPVLDIQGLGSAFAGRVIIYLGRLQERVDELAAQDKKPIASFNREVVITPFGRRLGFTWSNCLHSISEFVSEELKALVAYIAGLYHILLNHHDLAYLRDAAQMPADLHFWVEAKFRLAFLIRHDRTMIGDALEEIEKKLGVKGISDKILGKLNSFRGKPET